MSEVKTNVENNEVVTEVTTVTEKETGIKKFVGGVKKHGKKIAIGIGAIAVGLLGYGMIKRANSGCDCDCDDLEVIDVDYSESETIE